MSHFTTFPARKQVDLLEPTLAMIDARDIAHALGGIRRFNGYTKRYYTVAEHSIIGSYLVPPEFALEFLLHDAHEAYLGDVITPLKVLLGEKYTVLAERFDELIAAKFGLVWSEACDAQVKRVDALMLAVEFAELKFQSIDKDLKFRDAEVVAQWIHGGKLTRPREDFLQRLHELLAERYLEGLAEVGDEG